MAELHRSVSVADSMCCVEVHSITTVNAGLTLQSYNAIGGQDIHFQNPREPRYRCSRRSGHCASRLRS